MRLVAENLSGERGGEPVFSGIDFELDEGETLIVTGPNGAGKSTLLRVIAGLLPSAAGSVRLVGGGETWPSMAAACHYLGHQNAMKPAMTVTENLAFWREFCGEPNLGVAEATVAGWNASAFIARWDAVAAANDKLKSSPDRMTGEAIISFDALKEKGERQPLINDVETEWGAAGAVHSVGRSA